MLEVSRFDKEVVLIGGGHAHIEVLKDLGMKSFPDARVTIISREAHTVYSGMLPGLIAGHYDFKEAHIDLAPLAQFAHARFFHDEAVDLDLSQQKIFCANRPPIHFDLLSLDVGSLPKLSEGRFDGKAVVVKPVSNFFNRWRELEKRLIAKSGPGRLAIVGGGAGGAELALATQYRLTKNLSKMGQDPHKISFVLITSGNEVLPTHSRWVRKSYEELLKTRGIDLIKNFEVHSVQTPTLTSTSGEQVLADEILWVTNATAPDWIAKSGLEVDPSGFPLVDATLSSVSHSNVFAAGDIASIQHYNRPKSGVFAVRQGPILARNIRNSILKKRPVKYRPQKTHLSLISTGDKQALASHPFFYSSGKWVWLWKDYIDRKFVKKYKNLPSMSGVANGNADTEMHELMRCGGCGSKVSSSVLREALRTISPTNSHDDIVVGLNEPDDASIVKVPKGHLMVHTVDGFRSFMEDPWMIGKVAVIHALSDIYAMGATPSTALVMVTIPFAKTSLMQNDLTLVMKGIQQALESEKTILIGGHTTEGTELSVSLAVNGFVEQSQILKKTGASAGDKLVLTQSLGSGVIFAGSMQQKAKSDWVNSALQAMIKSKRAAANILKTNGARAMTDVTGFGLVGHLKEMFPTNHLGAELSLASIPLYEGAEILSKNGVESSLYLENKKSSLFVDSNIKASQSTRYPLLFDPQTSGGLLAAVPSEKASTIENKLIAAGYSGTSIIGTVKENAGRFRLTV